MKISYNSFLFVLAAGALAVSCGKDTYPEPKTSLTGNIVYKGEPIGVEHDQVRLQLWQPGFGQTGCHQRAHFSQEGSYSALLFDGNYKLVFPQNDGPWKTTIKDGIAKDTIFVTLNGNQKVDIEVTPYVMIRNAKITGGEKKVNATFGIEKIITGVDAKDIERVSLYISRTQFVSRANNIGVLDRNAADVKDLSNVTMTVNVPTISPAQDFVFARVGVKVKDVEDMVFSKAEKITY